jgi:hypothetical protein
MSFEGYHEYRCPAGHINRVDVYDVQPAQCWECGKVYVSERLVDETNVRTVKGRWTSVRPATEKEADGE